LFNYADAGYSSFVSTNSTRLGTVYAGANDGMLHAFNAATDANGAGGAELWAYVPTAVMPNLYKLTDKNYATGHQYFVDGSPNVGDAYFGGAWHTILVGGLNEGGRSYYALDVTNPTAPVLLWEFTDTNLGDTYGNPVITKLRNGTWVVIVTSGYNNVSAGDGLGHLYVLNAQTGAVISNVNTGVGSTATPSGLGRISAWVNSPMVDNTAQRAYGGDLLGNVWRFDVNGPNGDGISPAAPQLLATLKDASGTPQPITAKPELGSVSGNAVVYVGTGRYLGVSDLSNTSQQSFYAIKDTLGTTTYTNPRTYGGFVKQTEVNGTCPSTAPASVCGVGQAVRTSTSNPVSFVTGNGWYIDFPDSGERDNTDPILVLGTLTFNTNVPNVSACTVGGYSYRYFLDYSTGAALSNASSVVAASMGNSMSTSSSVVQSQNGSLIAITTHSSGGLGTDNTPLGPGATATRRVGWHELGN
jgi:type IV pilus assembly protein PilY1